MKLDFRQRLLATTLMVGAGMLATPAFAQDTAAPDTTGPVEAQPPAAMEAQPTDATTPADEGTRDIVVTGTRIPQANLESVAPVTVVSGQDFKLTGNTRVEDLLNSLPSVGASQASGVSNGASGTAEVDLRYLGSKRTLVLVNGRRLAPGDPNSTTQAADLNMIPSAIVKRAEVLTGGASSTYGADAVAGVVNFIMDTEFTGIRFDGQYSFYNHNNTCPGITNDRTVCDALDTRIGAGLNGYGYPGGRVTDGGTFDGTLAIGTGFDDNRGHIMAYFGYRKVNAVTQNRRDFSACALGGAGNPHLLGLCHLGRRQCAAVQQRCYRRNVHLLLHSGRTGHWLRARARCSTSTPTTTSSVRTSGTSLARSRTMKSRRPSSRTLSSCSWTITRRRRSLRRVTSATPS